MRGLCKAIIGGISLFASACFVLASDAWGQESSSQPQPNSGVAALAGPSATLRDALSAACAHNDKDFADAFTATNRDAFSRMTPAARVSLMKRFVLLDNQGQSSVSANPAGRPIVRCHTSVGTAEMQIGGVDARENLAFIPLEVRDAEDSETNAMHIRVGMIREGGQWKILSLGLLLLDLPSLEAEWDAAEVGPNEQEALRTLKNLAAAVENYRKTFTHLPESLAVLGPPLHGAPGAQAANLVDSDIANGVKGGYTFRYVITTPSTSGVQARFELAATPATYARGGRRSFFRDSDGGFHAADHQGAVGSSADPPIE
jgi:hypothetical protein